MVKIIHVCVCLCVRCHGGFFVTLLFGSVLFYAPINASYIVVLGVDMRGWIHSFPFRNRKMLVSIMSC